MSKLLLAGVSLFALAMTTPAFAQTTPSGSDDNATITQTSESVGYASQNQPGSASNAATITQISGAYDSAVQQQAPSGNGFARGGDETITQIANYAAQANQQDNSLSGTQSITQNSNNIFGYTKTSATQLINTSSGSKNAQTATQIGNVGTTIAQTIGTAPALRPAPIRRWQTRVPTHCRPSHKRSAMGPATITNRRRRMALAM